MSLKLSKRMKKIVEMCEPVDVIVDVGSDHGKVAISIANEKIANEVVAIDNKIMPLKNCDKNAKIYLNDNASKFTTLLSDGLDKFDKERESGIIITGIGFDNMKNILSNIFDYNFKYLILSPHTKITELIRFLSAHNLNNYLQESIYEDEKYYYILKVYR